MDSGEKLLDIKCEGPMNSIAWHPKQYLLAYVTDEREKQPPKISVSREFCICLYIDIRNHKVSLFFY